MQKVIKYVIFQTKWGYFGLAGTEYGLLRTHLPGPKHEKIKSLILKKLLAINQYTSIEHRASRFIRRRRNPVSSIQYRESSTEHRASLVRRLVRRSASEVGSFSEGGSIEFDKTFFKMLQEQITAYFDGTCVNFSPAIPIFLDGFTQFCSLVLTACREVKFGQTISYSQLAKKVGRPAASRAVGNALAKNPLPLIIPCHRVVRSDGSLGSFSAPGGKKLKKKLLNYELAALTCSKDCPDIPVLRKFLL
jgi:O-6-methylguanine DNA methyltransferase